MPPATPAVERALVLTPMTSELRPVVKYAKARKIEPSGETVYLSRVGRTEILVARAGVGPEPAGAVAARLIAAFNPSHVVVCGIAGGLHPSMTIGTVVVPETVLDLRNDYRYRAAPLGDLERRGLVTTADHLIVDEGRLSDLAHLGVLAMEMESAGVAETCEAAGVPWTTVRVIADRPDDELTDDVIMSLLRPDGTADVMAALRLMARHPSRIPQMLRLARDSSMAADKAARATIGALGA